MKTLLAVVLPLTVAAAVLAGAATPTPDAEAGPTVAELERQVEARVDARLRVQLAKLAAEARADGVR